MSATMTSAALTPFYATTTAVLIGLLVTWLVAEARELGTARAAVSGQPDAPLDREIGPSDLSWMLATAFVLVAGAISALRVQYRGSAAPIDDVVIWAALILGFVSVPFSMTVKLVANRTAAAGRTSARILRAGRRLLPLIAAMIAGIAASPLFSSEQPRIVGAKFRVYGTCLVGGCGLKQRAGPGRTFRETGRRLRDGEQVLVMCQALGTPPRGVGSRVWNKLSGGGWVSDAFVETGNSRGGFSDELPRCSAGASSLDTAG